MCCNNAQFLSCIESRPLFKDRTVQTNAVIKSFKPISATGFRSDGPDLLQRPAVTTGKSNPFFYDTQVIKDL